MMTQSIESLIQGTPPSDLLAALEAEGVDLGRLAERLQEPSALSAYRCAASAYESSVARRDYKTLADNYKALKPAYEALEAEGDAAAMCRVNNLPLGHEWRAPEMVGR